MATRSDLVKKKNLHCSQILANVVTLDFFYYFKMKAFLLFGFICDFKYSMTWQKLLPIK